MSLQAFLELFNVLSCVVTLIFIIGTVIYFIRSYRALQKKVKELSGDIELGQPLININTDTTQALTGCRESYEVFGDSVEPCFIEMDIPQDAWDGKVKVKMERSQMIRAGSEVSKDVTIFIESKDKSVHYVMEKTWYDSGSNSGPWIDFVKINRIY